jgi:hypothetical protein
MLMLTAQPYVWGGRVMQFAPIGAAGVKPITTFFKASPPKSASTAAKPASAAASRLPVDQSPAGAQGDERELGEPSTAADAEPSSSEAYDAPPRGVTGGSGERRATDVLSEAERPSASVARRTLAWDDWGDGGGDAQKISVENHFGSGGASESGGRGGGVSKANGGGGGGRADGAGAGSSQAAAAAGGSSTCALWSDYYSDVVDPATLSELPEEMQREAMMDIMRAHKGAGSSSGKRGARPNVRR